MKDAVDVLNQRIVDLEAQLKEARITAISQLILKDKRIAELEAENERISKNLSMSSALLSWRSYMEGE